MGALFGAVGVLLLVLGPIGIVRPRWFKLRRRRHAVFLWSLWIPLAGTGGALMPPEPSGESPMTIWVVILIFWLAIVGIGWLICRALDRRAGRSNDTAPSHRVAEEAAALRRMGAKSVGRSPVAYHDDELEGPVNRLTPLRFEYVDQDGVVTDREIIDWVDTRFYVKGICTTRHAMRTFRKDRIETWTSGQEALQHGVLRFGRTTF